MKDTEKAEEIASTYHYLAGGVNNEETMKIYVEDACRQMAEWKDEQLYNELFELSLSSNTYDYMMWVCNKKKELEEQLKNKSNEKAT